MNCGPLSERKEFASCLEHAIDARRADCHDVSIEHHRRRIATFSCDVKRFRILWDMGKLPLEILPYSSERFVPFRLKRHRTAVKLTLCLGEVSKQYLMSTLVH